MRKVGTAARDSTELGIQQQRTTLLEKPAAEELVQMLAQDVADKDAPVGGGQPGRTSALVDLDQGAPFEGNRLLDTKTALGDQRVAKLRHHWREKAVYACWDTIFAVGTGGPRSGEQPLKAAERANCVDAAWERERSSVMGCNNACSMLLKASTTAKVQLGEVRLPNAAGCKWIGGNIPILILEKGQDSLGPGTDCFSNSDGNSSCTGARTKQGVGNRSSLSTGKRSSVDLQG